MDEFERVQERLTRARPTLSPTLSRAAAYLLEKPADVVTMSMRELARAANIPAPNFSRLAQRIGFAQYSTLRAVYRRRVQTGKPIADSTADQTPASSDADRGSQALWEAFRHAALGNLEAAFKNVDSAVIASVADEVRARDRVYLVATYAPHQLARYLHSIGSMAAPSFRLVGRDGSRFADDLVDIGERDALICLSSTSSDEAAVHVARIGRERGALVIGITESRTTSLAAVADRLLLVPLGSPSFFQSHVGTVAVIEMLVGFIVHGTGSAATQRIDRILLERRRFG